MPRELLRNDFPQNRAGDRSGVGSSKSVELGMRTSTRFLDNLLGYVRKLPKMPVRA